MMRTTIIGLLTLAYVGVIAAMTLGPQPGDAQTTGLVDRLIRLVDRDLWPTFTRPDLEFLGNVAMFAPLGLLLILLLGRRNWWVVLVIGIAATCSIEFSQQFIPTRVPDIRDIIANSLGALAGTLVGMPFAPRIRRPSASPNSGVEVLN